MKKLLILSILAFAFAQAKSQTIIPIEGYTTDTTYYYGTFTDFLRKNFFVKLPGDGLTDYTFNLNDAQSGFKLDRKWVRSATAGSIYYPNYPSLTYGVGIGTATPEFLLDITRSANANLGIHSDNNTSVSIYNGGSGQGIINTFGYGGTWASKTAVANNRVLGRWNGGAWDGNSWHSGFYMDVVVDGTVADNAVPTAWELYTNQIGFGGPGRRLRISNRGRIAFGTHIPIYWMDVNANENNTSAIMQLRNLQDSVRVFVHSTTNPNSVVTARPGDVLAGAGGLFQKITGLNTNTNWGQFLNRLSSFGATTGQTLAWDGDSWEPAALPSGDNLGNHIATQALNMNTQALNNASRVSADSCDILNPGFQNSPTFNYQEYTTTGTLNRELAHYWDGSNDDSLTVNTALPDETIFFVKNNDAGFLLTILPGSGRTMNGEGRIWPGETVWFQRHGTVIERITPFRRDYRADLSPTTDSNGDFTVTHNLGTTSVAYSFASICDACRYSFRRKTTSGITSNTIVVRVIDETTGLALASTSLSVSVTVQRIN